MSCYNLQLTHREVSAGCCSTLW